ncbi:hypothetical protein SAMN05661086_00941 [Anaeromicropila populeti]|uniref:Uncharacterized protein n=1 Tax=Anaeromicropila populeti TaxID=37658 RepID=A0A1I6INB1_9FIRM|nr:hypothetical protein SAMN05661086_00941 [Anaeromicropila populeti]
MTVEMDLYSRIFNKVCKSFGKAGTIAGLGLKYINKRETKEKVIWIF